MANDPMVSVPSETTQFSHLNRPVSVLKSSSMITGPGVGVMVGVKVGGMGVSVGKGVFVGGMGVDVGGGCVGSGVGVGGTAGAAQPTSNAASTASQNKRVNLDFCILSPQAKNLDLDGVFRSTLDNRMLCLLSIHHFLLPPLMHGFYV
jgi:hypothetical protein